MGLLQIDKKQYFIIVFSNETKVIQNEMLLKNKGFETKIISIPRKISSGCGMALRCKISDKEKIIDLINKNNIKYVSIINMEEI